MPLSDPLPLQHEHAIALRHVLFGDLLALRGFAYLALLLALACMLATWRARRVYVRTVNTSATPPAALMSSTDMAVPQLHEQLRQTVTAKLRAVLQWLLVACMLLAAQANMLALEAPPWTSMEASQYDITFYPVPDGAVAVRHYDTVGAWFAVLALCLAIVWILTHLVGDESDPPVMKRARYWIADLVMPTKGTKLNELQRMFAWLRLVDVHTHKRH